MTARIVGGLFLAVSVWAADARPADPDGIRWLVQYDGRQPPARPTWTPRGQINAKVVDSALHVVDDSKEECCFRAKWKADSSQEIVVEARVKVGSLTGSRGKSTLWPWRDGAPIGVRVSDGRHQEGLCLTPRCVRTFTDRFFELNTTSGFHVYRLVIRGTDMSIYVDGTQRIRGQGAFWKPADSPESFIEFGSTSPAYTGDSYWEYVRLGLRKPTSKPEPERLKITIGEPWEITRPDKVPQTRPYLYNMGQGLLLLSVAQGPDAYWEPYGALKSTDAGRIWTPIEQLDQNVYAPQPMLRLRDGSILGVSRWNKMRGDALVGQTVHFNAQGEPTSVFDNRIYPPPDAMVVGERWGVFDRHIFEESDGSILAVVYGRSKGGSAAHLMKTTDRGETWRHASTIAPFGETAVARLSPTEMTAVCRQGTMMPMRQVWSHDGGKTWSEPAVLEVGSVDPDVELMSNGVLACSYGRPSSCIMFSLDQGKTWKSHRVISDAVRYNYTAIREIRPGRLLYMHDAPNLRALYIDVERVKP